MGTSTYTLGVDEWTEDGVTYARSFRDQITLPDAQREQLESGDETFPFHSLTSRGHLIASYPNATATWQEGDRILAGTGSFFVRTYLRVDYPAPGWPPEPAKTSSPTNYGYDDMGSYMDMDRC